jgi:hypothetical protein
LGQSVLRLPFIVSTSLGHEVLHNWWGNSVAVDYERGNWCEAAAVYGADYRYKLLASPEAARDYRKDILKEYLSYVNAGNDFPLRQFTSRSSAETRAIGYGKGMMLLHLIERQVGTGPFFEAWKQAYRDYKGRTISWEEWISVFENTSGQNLGFIIPEWIDRAGAPRLGLEIIAVGQADTDGRRKVSIKITQSSDTPYHLPVPVLAEGPDIIDSTVVRISSAEEMFDFSISAGATSISLDPDFHLFRRLYPEEIEPIISAVLGMPDVELISFDTAQIAEEAFSSFGSALTEDSAKVLYSDQLDAVLSDKAPILLNPNQLPGYLAKLIRLTSDSVTIEDNTYPLAGHTVVMAGQNWNGFDKYLVVLTGDYESLPRLGQLVPHYGKYSYLMFSGTGNIAKGQWPVTESPMRLTIQ